MAPKKPPTSSAPIRVKDPAGKVRSRSRRPPGKTGEIQPAKLRNTNNGSAKRLRTLSAQQKAFVNAYMASGKVGESALAAGYTNVITGTSLLSKPKIKQEIARRQALIESRADEKMAINALKVIEEVAAIAFSNTGDLFNGWGTRKKKIVIPVKGAKPGQPATKEIEVEETFADIKGKDQMTLLQQRCLMELYQESDPRGKTRLRIKNHDKLKALQMLANYFGLTDGAGKRGDDAKDLVTELRVAAAEAEASFPDRNDFEPNTNRSEEVTDEEED